MMYFGICLRGAELLTTAGLVLKILQRSLILLKGVHGTLHPGEVGLVLGLYPFETIVFTVDSVLYPSVTGAPASGVRCARSYPDGGQCNG